MGGDIGNNAGFVDRADEPGRFFSRELLSCRRIIFTHEPKILFTAKTRLASRISSALNNRIRIIMADWGYCASGERGYRHRKRSALPVLFFRKWRRE